MDIKDQEQMTEVAALYALGALGTDELLAFEQLLGSDNELRAESQAFEALVADLALCVNEAGPSPVVREKLLARITDTEQEPKAVTAPLSKTVSPNVDIRVQEGNWMQLAEKVFCKTLFVDPQSGLVTSLVKLEPGGYLPRHRHLGVEQTLVVEGDCVINGQVFYPGDYRVRACDTEDGAVTTEHGTLIMLIAPERCEILDPSWPC
jgi:anti-sigma factor ChrR (cupin superfamily)